MLVLSMVVVCCVSESPGDVSVMRRVHTVPPTQEALFMQFRNIKTTTKTLSFHNPASAGATLREITDFIESHNGFLPLYRSHRSASLTSGLHSIATRVIPDNSDKDLGGWGEEWRQQKKKKRRRQLQIYTPPLDHCTSLKPEAASSGSVSVPAHTGCTRPPTRWFISAVVLNVFPRPERWELMRFTHVCREIHFWGEKNMQFVWRKRAPLANVSCLKPHSQRHCSTAGWRDQWWMFTFTLSLNIPQYHRHSFRICRILCSI